jgi:enoyl-CoA hydratase/carnithine racemase
MSEAHVLYGIEDHVATITLNRPKAKNAFSQEMLSLWRGYLEQARDDDQVRVIIVTGNGDTFCAGGDVRIMAEGRSKSWEKKRFLWERVHRIIFAMENLDKPVIAAINGAAAGAGMGMALMCDLRVCSDRGRLVAAYILRGLAPGDGAAYFLPRLVGAAKALEVLLTGGVINAEEALRLGIVNRVVPHEQLMNETRNLARMVAEMPPFAVKMIKRAVYQGLSSTLRAHLDYISSQCALLAQTADHIEAAQAFLEKRKPLFQGR